MKRLYLLTASLMTIALLTNCNKTKFYTVTFDSNGGTSVESQRIEENKTVVEPDVPSKEATAEFTFKFEEWQLDGIKYDFTNPVTQDITLKAKWQEIKQKYTVTWKNYDGEVLETDKDVSYGAVPKYDGKEPTREPTAKYKFTGWDKDTTKGITGDTVFTAQFSIQEYTITWKNDDGTVLETDKEIKYGTVPHYDGEEPKKQETPQYTYTFKGWDKDTTKGITGDTVFTAQYNENIRTYDITFVNYDGKELYKMDNSPYGTKIEYKGDTPTKPSTSELDFTFAGWDPELKESDVVTGNKTYTATYSSSPRKYTVTFLNDDGKTVLDEHEVDLDTMPQYKGAYPTKLPSGNNYYTFDKWEPELHKVKDDNNVYKAVYRTVDVTDVDIYIKLVIPDDAKNLFVQFSCYTSGSLVVDWGDNTVDSQYKHTYASAGEYDFKVKNVTNLLFNEGKDFVQEIYFGDGIDSISAISSTGADFNESSSLASIYISKNVRTIDHRVFKFCPAISSIVVDKNNQYYDSRNNANAIITSVDIGEEASLVPAHTLIFGCQTTIIPEGVKYIGSNAFTGSSIVSITVPEYVLSIGIEAFSECYNLTSISISKAVFEISNGVFKNCTSLSSVSFSNNVISIGKGAFFGCASLTEIFIPRSVAFIGESAFSGCISMESITVDSDNVFFDSRNDCNAIISKTDIESTTIKKDTLIFGCKNTVIPSSVVIIGEKAFQYCTSLESIYIPSSVTYIDRYAFSACNSLAIIKIDPNNPSYDSRNDCNAIITKTDIVVDKYTTIAKDTLIAGCMNTKIPDDVIAIYKGAFALCTSLTEIVISKNIETIGSGAFEGCSGLVSIKVSKENETFDSRNDCNAIISSVDISGTTIKKDTLIFGCKNTVIPSSVTVIGESAFRDCFALTSITIPNNITELKEETFKNCISLTLVDLSSYTDPNSVPLCGIESFDGCGPDLTFKVFSEEMIEAFTEQHWPDEEEAHYIVS